MKPFAAFAVSVTGVFTAPRPPSVLFVVIDDLGSADLGFHGSGIATPEIDRLAAEGLRLTSYYVQPSCSPTRSAFLSGRYPLHTGINNWIPDNATYGLPADDETLAQVMRRAGYQAHAVGKWHVGHGKWSLTPTFRGFESFFGFYQGGEGYFAHDSEGAYDLRRDSREHCGEGCSTVADERDNYSTHVFVREAIAVLEHHSFDKGPLFLYLAFQAVHGPDEVPSSYRVPYEGRSDWNDIRKTYAGMLSAADEGITNVTAALTRLGVEDEFLIVVTTDNGGPTETGWVQGSSNWPRRGGKCTIWEGGTAGDAIIWGRGLGIGPGTSPHLFHAVDWLPTLADLAGVSPAGKPLDGVSQLGSLAGGPPSRTEIFYGVTDDEVGVQGPALRVGSWKLIVGTGGDPGGWPLPGNTSIEPRRPTPPVASGFLLFDLEADPEERNALDLEKHADVFSEIHQRLQWYRSSGVPQARNDPMCPLCVLGRGQPGCFIDDDAVGKAWKPWCSDAEGRADWV